MASSNPTAPAAVDDTDALVHERNGVLTIAVSTAGAGNSLDDAALAAGTQALREVARGQRDVGAVLLVGLGKNFCAGGDVRTFASKGEALPDYLREATTWLQLATAGLIQLRVPVVTAVQGFAAGGGTRRRRGRHPPGRTGGGSGHDPARRRGSARRGAHRPVR